MTGVLGDWGGATGLCFFGDIFFDCCFGGREVLCGAC